jgi:metal-responsive CopG/Arc/MetJ family transcriptional regulator
MARQKRDPTNPLVMKNFMAPAKLLAQLQELSEKERVSESEIIRTAVEQYVREAQKHG